MEEKKRRKRRLKKLSLQKVENLAKKGLCNRDMAMCLGITEMTFYKHLREDPEFAEAIKRGKAIANEFVVGKLFDNINSCNQSAIQFYLKCQAGWSETQKIEVEQHTDANIKIDESVAKDAISRLTTDDILSLIRKQNEKDETEG